MAARFFDQAPERGLCELWHARPQCPRFCPRFNMGCPDIFGHMRARRDIAMSRITSYFQCVKFFCPQSFQPSSGAVRRTSAPPGSRREPFRVPSAHKRAVASATCTSRPHLGALLLGYYSDDGQLIYADRPADVAPKPPGLLARRAALSARPVMTASPSMKVPSQRRPLRRRWQLRSATVRRHRAA
jgi:hypothetical protein